jgi:hypothetical protein
VLHFAVDPQTGIDATVDRVLGVGGWVNIEPYDSELGRIRASRRPHWGQLRAHRPHHADPARQ